MQQPKTIYLSDYKPAPYSVDTIDLEVDIHSEYTQVISRMNIIKRESSEQAHLELNGEELTLLEIKINGKVLANSAYQISSDKLVILNPPDGRFTVEIKNRIHPQDNKSMEGFYASGEQLCTQCEAEGFRRITYFIDRPDVMAKFKTKMIAEKKRYPYLLSNGNLIGRGELSEGRHWVEWEDPFRKPCYLFAMVAGDFDVARDHFVTKSGRNVKIEIFVDKGNLYKTGHAIESLKQSMKWDEDTFGLEYDLDIYMIVAVDSFNSGAMENKGLNIFNSTYTLADEKSGTDHDFQNIQGVIGHEYFHNWTGNRVTCRDWFQLTLKEGLTVFRDQEFSSDMLSRAVKRLEDVRLMKEVQFAEDAGPLAHPIRPNSYIEINNFYTRTIYEKGSEVIRMIHTLIGKENFRKGMDKYFELYDGQAVTTEDFVNAMEVASGKDLSQFKNWYSRPGTPTLVIKTEKKADEFVLEIEQKYPPTTWKVPEGNILHMPFKLSLIEKDGTQNELNLELKKMKETFSFKTKGIVIPSLNRGFSAPVHVDYKYDFEELLHLMSFDRDAYCRYEAVQKVYDVIFQSEFNQYKASGELNLEMRSDFKEALSKLIHDESIDHSFKSYLLELPSESGLCQEMHHPDFDAIHFVHRHLRKKIGLAFQDWFLNEHEHLSKAKKFELTTKAFGERALKNKCLTYLVASETSQGLERLGKHYRNATNMTEEIHGLIHYVESGVSMEHAAIQDFYHKWKNDSLVMIKWFSALSGFSPKESVFGRLTQLERDPLFEGKIPNYLRSLYFHFSRNNLHSFHDENGEGYYFLAERIKQIDRFNPQLASKAAAAFSLINKLDDKRKSMMHEALEGIMKTGPSRDTFEVVSKYLAQ